jgi:hypothetical protein
MRKNIAALALGLSLGLGNAYADDATIALVMNNTCTYHNKEHLFMYSGGFFTPLTGDNSIGHVEPSADIAEILADVPDATIVHCHIINGETVGTGLESLARRGLKRVPSVSDNDDYRGDIDLSLQLEIKYTKTHPRMTLQHAIAIVESGRQPRMVYFGLEKKRRMHVTNEKSFGELIAYYRKSLLPYRLILKTDGVFFARPIDEFISKINRDKVFFIDDRGYIDIPLNSLVLHPYPTLLKTPRGSASHP